jgi:hypothetical protein
LRQSIRDPGPRACRHGRLSQDDDDHRHYHDDDRRRERDHHEDCYAGGLRLPSAPATAARDRGRGGFALGLGLSDYPSTGKVVLDDEDSYNKVYIDCNTDFSLMSGWKLAIHIWKM